MYAKKFINSTTPLHHSTTLDAFSSSYNKKEAPSLYLFTGGSPLFGGGKSLPVSAFFYLFRLIVTVLPDSGTSSVTAVPLS